MKRTQIIIAGGLFIAGALTPVFADDKETLETTAKATEVQQELSQPEGATIFLKEDGAFQIFARGTGTYDFDDPDDVNDARKMATLKAKAAISKFMKEKLSSEEGCGEASKKVKTLTTNGETETVNVSKETIQQSASFIKNSSEALLKGVITLEDKKIPRGKSSGEVQVTVGLSSKTLKVAEKVTKTLEGQSETKNDSPKSAPVDSKAKGEGNKPETRKAQSDF